MQNSRLDGLVVLFTQIQMINRIARIYVQRPSRRELARLYVNVAGTAVLTTSSLESLDLGELLAPLVTLDRAGDQSQYPRLDLALPFGSDPQISDGCGGSTPGPNRARNGALMVKKI
jgi:hypothetical protein